MSGSFKYIDFNKDIFVKESVLVMTYTKGGVTLKNLELMPFVDYEKYLQEAIRIQNLDSKGEPKIDG